MAFLEDLLDNDRSWNLVALVSTGLATVAVRNLLALAWEKSRGEEPHENPASGRPRSVAQPHWGRAFAPVRPADGPAARREPAFLAGLRASR